jgi:hypothetical protein
MTNVLITVASRMGSTREIGETIAQQLRADGLSVDVRDCAQDPDPTHYRAVIIGSAIYFADGYLMPADTCAVTAPTCVTDRCGCSRVVPPHPTSPHACPDRSGTGKPFFRPDRR